MGIKRKFGLGNIEDLETAVKKKTKKENLETQSLPLDTSPRGSQWSNNSCAFDAVISLLYNIWLDDMNKRSIHFRHINEVHMGMISDSFSQTQFQNSTNIRDFVRRRLQRIDPISFAWGQFTSIQSILDHFLATSYPITSSLMFCPNNHPVNRDARLGSTCQITILQQCSTIQDFVDDQTIHCASSCQNCHSHLLRKQVFIHPSPNLNHCV